MLKTLLPATALVTGVLMLACGQATTAPSEVVSDPAAPTFSATHFRTSFDVVVDELFPVPCANGGSGEDVRITGHQTTWIKQTTSASGHSTFLLHIQPGELIGVGETTGDIYRSAKSPGQIVEIEQGDGAPFVTVVFPQPIVLLGRGPGAATILIYTSVKVVVNNNGELKVLDINFSAKCIER